MIADSRILSRLRNMAIFFVRRTKNVDIRKLEKLFYFTDLLSFLTDGFTLSGQKYYACETGPRPKMEGKYLYDALDFPSFLTLNEKNFFETDEEFVKDKFSPYECEILEQIAVKYRDSSGKWLSDITHKKGELWAKTIAGAGPEAEMDFSVMENKNFSQEDVLEDKKHRTQLREFGVFLAGIERQ